MGKTSIMVDTLDRLAVQLAGIQEAAAKLREIGPFEEAIASLKQQHATLLQEVGDAKLELKATREQAAQTVDAARSASSRVAEAADEALREARTQAEQIVSEARKQAADELNEDRGRREDILKDLQAQIVKIRKQVDVWDGKARQALEKAETAEGKLKVAEASLQSFLEKTKTLSEPT